ncbi:hypothetical protein SOVF_160680, partial [Spinacia oleracea]
MSFTKLLLTMLRFTKLLLTMY